MDRHAVMLMVCGFLAVSVHASAQTTEWADRGYVNVNFGVGGATSDVSDARDFSIYQETGRIAVEGDVDAGAFFDLAGGARVWRNVSVGLAYYRASSDGDAIVRGTVPHPVFFGRDREFSTEVRGLERTVNGTHLSVGYMFIVNDKVDVLAYAGPSFFSVSQEVVSDVQIAETGSPFTSLVVNPVVSKRKDSPVGGHFGADVTYRIYETGSVKLGAGAFLRYSKATAEFDGLASPVKNDVGGFQFGFGLRTRF